MKKHETMNVKEAIPDGLGRKDETRKERDVKTERQTRLS